jgi:CRP-like cAMP-binding protein
MENKIATLLKQISPNVPLPPADMALCEQYFEYITFARNSIVEAEGKLPQYLYFIVSGYMRLFHYNEEGDEVTSLLASPGNFITSFLSFVNNRTSQENTECITDCELFRIKGDHLRELIAKSEKFKDFSLVIFENAISHSNQRANDLATLKASKRYEKLMAEQPHLLQNVPIQYIASYLGVKPQSLSRIRAQLIK